MMNEPRSKSQPSWANPAAWVFTVVVVALLALAVAQSEEWTERIVLMYGGALLGLFGIGFLMSSYSPDGPVVFRYLVRLAQRGRRRFRLSGQITGGDPRAAGWLCLFLAAALVVLSVFI